VFSIPLSVTQCYFSSPFLKNCRLPNFPVYELFRDNWNCLFLTCILFMPSATEIWFGYLPCSCKVLFIFIYFLLTICCAYIWAHSVSYIYLKKRKHTFVLMYLKQVHQVYSSLLISTWWCRKPEVNFIKVDIHSCQKLRGAFSTNLKLWKSYNS